MDAYWCAKEPFLDFQVATCHLLLTLPMPFVQLAGRGTSVAYKVALAVESLSHVWLFVTPWTVTHQAPLSMGFSRQEYWSGLPFLPPGDLPNPGIEPMSPALAGRLFTTEPPGNPSLQGSPYKLSFVSIILQPGVQLVTEQSLFTDCRSLSQIVGPFSHLPRSSPSSWCQLSDSFLIGPWHCLCIWEGFSHFMHPHFLSVKQTQGLCLSFSMSLS